jgi:hypothetical protein
LIFGLRNNYLIVNRGGIIACNNLKMQHEKYAGTIPFDEASFEKIKSELGQLDTELVDAGGILLKPSQCYRIGTDPYHILFNTNCPDHLKSRIETILSFYQKS